MKQQSAAIIIPSGTHALNSSEAGEITTAFKNTEDFKNFFQQYHLPNLDDLLMKLAAPAGKKSFLVDKENPWAAFDDYIDRVVIKTVNTLTPKWSTRLAGFDVFIWD